MKTLEQRVQERAYEIWERRVREGREGDSNGDYLQAMKEVVAEESGPKSKSAAPKAAAKPASVAPKAEVKAAPVAAPKVEVKKAAPAPAPKVEVKKVAPAAPAKKAAAPAKKAVAKKSSKR